MDNDTQEIRFDSTEPMAIAGQYVALFHQTEHERPGLYRHLARLWRWTEGRWTEMDEEFLEDEVLRNLEDALVQAYNPKTKEMGWERLIITPKKMKDIVRCIHAVCSTQLRQPMPLWLPGHPQDPWSPKFIIAFKDVLLDAQTGLTIPRDDTWFDHTVMPVKYKPEAKAPRWEKAVQEWGGNDPVWSTLLQRMMGYALLNYREHAKWFLMYGKVRSGKGTIRRVLQHLLGSAGVVSISLADLSGTHGTDGLQHAKVLVVGEVAELESHASHRASEIIKNIVGRDPITVNPKNVRQLRNVMVPAVVILQSNEVPRLPNKGRGLSSKMVAMPFDVSFEKNPQLDLEEELMGEMEGIAAWCVRGAMDLLRMQTPEEQWPTPERAHETVQQYHLENNVFDSFLQELFVKDEKAFLPSAVLREMWSDWARKNDVRLHVPESRLVGRLVNESSWAIHPHRAANGGRRGVLGLGIKAKRDD